MAIIAKIILKIIFSSVLVLKFSRSTYSRIAHIVAQNVAVKDSINLLMFFSPFDNVFDLKILSGFRLVLPKFRPVTRSMCYAFWETDSLYTCPGVPFNTLGLRLRFRLQHPLVLEYCLLFPR